MTLFILFIIFGIIALITLGAAAVSPVRGGVDQDIPAKAICRVIGVIVIAVAAICLLFASIVQVDTKNLGVITTFGRPSGSLDNGIHFKAPWTEVTEISDKVQTDTYASDNGHTDKTAQAANGACVNVRIARQATACLNVSIRWQIQESGVDYLFRNFQDNEHITQSLVFRNLQTVINEVIGGYNPYNIDEEGNNLNKPLSASSGPAYSTDILNRIRATMPVVNGKSVVDIQSVNLPLIQYDGKTQGNINSILSQIALTQVAKQAKLTADAQAAANSALAASLNSNPSINTANCLIILKEAVDKGMSPSAGFSCFGPGTTAAVPAK